MQTLEAFRLKFIENIVPHIGEDVGQLELCWG